MKSNDLTSNIRLKLVKVQNFHEKKLNFEYFPQIHTILNAVMQYSET